MLSRCLDAPVAGLPHTVRYVSVYNLPHLLLIFFRGQRECQSAEWKRHKQEPCRPLKDLVDDDDVWNTTGQNKLGGSKQIGISIADLLVATLPTNPIWCLSSPGGERFAETIRPRDILGGSASALWYNMPVCGSESHTQDRYFVQITVYRWPSSPLGVSNQATAPPYLC